jgi:DNA-binding response OmpR family regulator
MPAGGNKTVRKAAKEGAVHETGAAPGRGAAKDILVIDDDSMNTQLFGDICDSMGWRALSAGDGEEGVRKAEDFRPDLIILDLMMPRLDGFGVLAELRSDPALDWIPVIVVSALSAEESEARALELGAIEYVRKPFSVEHLRNRMASALRISAERRRAPVRSDVSTGGELGDDEIEDVDG